MRHGTKAGRGTVVVYVALTGNANRMAGFAVSRAVGGAVVRNRVKRRLRAVVAQLLPTLPAGARVVIRALPAAAVASFAVLRGDIADGLATASRRARAL